MIIMSSLIGNWEKISLGPHSNLAILAFLFMVCAIEVVLLKMTTSPSVFSVPGDALDTLDDSSEYEEDIYYEDLHNNYDHWARRRMRQQRALQQREQELLRQFRQQQLQEQQQRHQQQPGFTF